MRVLLFSLYLPLGRDGVSNSTRQLVSSLEREGVECSVCTTDWGWPQEGRDEGKVSIFRAPFGNNFEFSPDMMNRFRKTCGEYDVIHFNSTYSFASILGGRIAERRGVPFVVSPRGNAIPCSWRGGQAGMRHPGRKRLFFVLVARRLLRRASRVVCTSEMEMKAAFRETGTDNVMYIPNGLNVGEYGGEADAGLVRSRLGIEPDQPVFLFLGRMAEEKALPFLLEAWEKVSARLPRGVLVIGGSDENAIRQTLERRAARLARPGSVMMPGVVTGSLKKALLQRSACVVLPSYSESFGNVVLEALASGTPVIASTGTPWEKVRTLGLGDWLPHDVDAWAEAMIRMEREPVYRSGEFAARSREWVTVNFSWPAVARRYAETYEKVRAEAARRKGLPCS